jgi:hypothetical protein
MDPSSRSTLKSFEFPSQGGAMKIRTKMMSLALVAAFAAPAFAVTDAEVEEMQAELRKLRVKVEALEDAREDYGFKGLKISGMADPVYLYNKRRNSAGFNFLSNFTDTDGDGNQVYAYDNSYFGQFLLQFDKETDSGTKIKLALTPHKSTSSGFNLNSIVHEATVSVPLTDLQTRLIAGQIPDWSGYEYYFSHQQKLITHNLLFDFSIPSFYQGAGIELVRGKWWVRGAIANLNQVSHPDGTTNQVATYRVDYSKGEFEGFGFAGQHGKYLDKRLDMFELDAYFVRGDWTVYGQVGAGKWKDMAFNGKDASWTGASVFAAYKITPRFEVIGRADHIRNEKNGGGTIGTVFGGCSDATGVSVACSDATAVAGSGDGRNGFGPAQADIDATVATAGADAIKGANRSALSIGLSYVFNTNTTFKFEYRYDRSSQATFLNSKDLSFEKTNQLYATSVVVTF